MAIKYLKHNEINKDKWDNCIEKSSNGLVYALSWYIDIIAPNWHAIVLNDYNAVLPLPWKKKYGLKYIYHPLFAQQLGVFFQGSECPDIELFLNAIPNSFIKSEISFNYANTVNCNNENKRLNSILSLKNSYALITKNFNTNTKRNLKKELHTDWVFNNSVDVKAFLNLKKENPVNNLTPSNFRTLENLFSDIISRGFGNILGIVDSENNLVSAALFVKYKNRIIYLFSASANTGKTNSSMFKIVNKIITDNAESDFYIDFEGSMVEGVARFFKGFGASSEFYYRISKSILPFL